MIPTAFESVIKCFDQAVGAPKCGALRRSATTGSGIESVAVWRVAISTLGH